MSRKKLPSCRTVQSMRCLGKRSSERPNDFDKQFTDKLTFKSILALVGELRGRGFDRSKILQSAKDFQ